jgi:threonine dehydrogenase-like Zn-dependent dehydrogenase
MDTAANARTATMRAAVLADAGIATLADVPRPEPGPRQVRIRIEGSGVCGSDIPVWQGREWFGYPREPGAPGHEGWGVVDAIGGDVVGLAPGMRVASLGCHAYAEYDVADAAEVVPLPGELDGAPFPGEALGCAVNVFRRSAITAGQTVAIVGAGFLGSLLIQLAARAGAEVIAVSRRSSALDVARRMGAEETFVPGDDVPEAIASLTAGRLCDCVVEAVGRQETLDLAGGLVGERGRLVIAGFHQDGRRSVDMQLWNWRGIDVVNAHERELAIRAGGVKEAARMVVGGELDPDPLYTHRFPLAELGQALAAAAERPDGFMKALVGA